MNNQNLSYNGNRIPAIPTKYHGIRFRSKLEARWAMFFDLLGILWAFEPEGLRPNGIYYDPDFLIFNVFEIGVPGSRNLYVEVKGLMEDRDRIKIDNFINIDNNKVPQNQILILGALPKSKDEMELGTELFFYPGDENTIYFFDSHTINGGDGWPVFLGIDKQGKTHLCYVPGERGDRPEYDWEKIFKAFDIARNYDFDHEKANADYNLNLIREGIEIGLNNITKFLG